MNKEEKIFQFTKRKKEQLQTALQNRSQTPSTTGLENLQLSHEAFPELDFEEVNIQTELFSHSISSPLFVSSMTAGYKKGEALNLSLAEICQEKKWVMGLGSQKKQLLDPDKAYKEWDKLRKAAPSALLMANIGLTEVIQHPPHLLLELAQAVKAIALIVHTNPLQECFQDGSPARFKGGYQALAKLIEKSPLPIVVKETGCGFSQNTLQRLNSLKIKAIDISGLGGTHWGLVEGLRSQNKNKWQASQNFASWGINTVESLRSAVLLQPQYEIWASGGIRSGVDAAKLIAVGAHMVGLAQPIMKEAIKGKKRLRSFMETLEFELKIALFCTGCKTLKDLQQKKVWSFKKK